MNIAVIVGTIASAVGAISGIYALIRGWLRSRDTTSTARLVEVNRQADQVIDDMRTNHTEQVSWYQARIQALEAENERLRNAQN